MLVSFLNNVKVYNLTVGKSLPEWLSERKKRKLLRGDVELRRRIELIQNFEMPDSSSCVELTSDRNYVYAAGTYKPRLRCYDVRHMSMKFERGLDSEVIRMKVLSDSYEKLALLEEDRWLEFHSQNGRYFRTRIPRFGRDFAYVESTCDLYITTAGSNIYRLNLELGQFLSPLATSASSLSACDVCREHNIFVCGTTEGTVEAFDPRSKRRIAILNCSLGHEDNVNRVGGITAVKFRNPLQIGIGTESGQILMYDVRSDRPYRVKDHNYDLPVIALTFNAEPNVVLSLDRRALKIWHEDSGKAYTTIEPDVKMNGLCVVPNSGLIFIPNEGKKILSYYVPSLGPAPRWCSFLDNITEELEESAQPTVYDDYKFLTSSELEDLGLSHLIGTNLLRAYMHGYFIDARLYMKAKDLMNPYAYKEYRQRKIKEKLQEERRDRVQVNNLPRVNRNLAERLIREGEGKSAGSGKLKKKQKRAKEIGHALLEDQRFKALFENPDFQVVADDEELALLNPVLSKMERMKQQKLAKQKLEEEEEEETVEGDEDIVTNSETEPSDADSLPETDDENENEEVASSNGEEAETRLPANNRPLKEKPRLTVPARKAPANKPSAQQKKPGRHVHIQDFEDVSIFQKQQHCNDAMSLKKLTLGERLEMVKMEPEVRRGAGSSREMVIQIQNKRAHERQKRQEMHIKERRLVRRSARTISKKLPQFHFKRK